MRPNRSNPSSVDDTNRCTGKQRREPIRRNIDQLYRLIRQYPYFQIQLEGSDVQRSVPKSRVNYGRSQFSRQLALVNGSISTFAPASPSKCTWPAASRRRVSRSDGLRRITGRAGGVEGFRGKNSCRIVPTDTLITKDLAIPRFDSEAYRIPFTDIQTSES
jgi:hypothetical protein